jgi:hypothetical protein
MKQCIGKRDGVRCSNQGEPVKPEWDFLCSECANEPARKGSRNSSGIVMERPVWGNYIDNSRMK